MAAPVSAPPAHARPRLLNATPTLVSAIVTLTAYDSGAKKKRHERMTIGSPAKITATPAVVSPRLYDRYSGTAGCGSYIPGRAPTLRTRTSAIPAGNR